MPRSRLDDIAQRIEPVSVWDNLVLPKPQVRILRAVAAHFQKTNTLGRALGVAGRRSPRLGTSVLFSGSSGTSKTMAAEILARELRLDLYRIDLSQVVSKYIGETEKNLKRVFDAAEGLSVILLFDEADALFGKRTEVNDSHDRCRNAEVRYLFERTASARILVLLATVKKAHLPAIWLRRMRFVVHFP